MGEKLAQEICALQAKLEQDKIEKEELKKKLEVKAIQNTNQKNFREEKIEIEGCSTGESSQIQSLATQAMLIPHQRSPRIVSRPTVMQFFGDQNIYQSTPVF